MSSTSSSKEDHAASSSFSSSYTSSSSCLVSRSKQGGMNTTSTSSSSHLSRVVAGRLLTLVAPPSTAARPEDLHSREDTLRSLSGLHERAETLAAERDHVRHLGQQSSSAFEKHRQDLTLLLQKERAIHGHREDVVRTQLQETLRANSELMARVTELRRQQEDILLAELRECRSSNEQRHNELTATVCQLHSEWDELRRSVGETEAARDEHRRDINECLQDQQQLRAQLLRLQKGLRAVERTEEVSKVQDEMKSRRDFSLTARDLMEHIHQSPQRTTTPVTRQPCCSYCDVGPDVWDGPSPTRRVPRRHFVPCGPLDACSPSPAISPYTHHIDAILSTIERWNYLRPRQPLQRSGRAPTDFCDVRGTPSPYRRRYDSRRAVREPTRAPHLASVNLMLHSRSRQGGLGDRQRHHSPGLSSSSASTGLNDFRTPHTSSTCSSACLTTCSSCVRCRDECRQGRGSALAGEDLDKGDISSGNLDALTHRHRRIGDRCTTPSRQASSPRDTSFASSRHRTGRREAGTSPLVERRASRASPNTHAHTVHPLSPSSSPFPPTPGPTAAAKIVALPSKADNLHGAALNATCRALLIELADIRAEYRRYHQQLRDPKGDCVAASRAMRQLMHQMDVKSDQVRALRREQGRHSDALRMHDVLRQIMSENRYCEAVYRDLVDLIRT